MSTFFGFPATASAGDFLPIIKYDARSGMITRIDRVPGADGFTSEPVDITQTFKAVFDFDNLEVGWMLFKPGMAPDMHLAKYGDPLPARPSADHKPGVRLLIKLAKDCAGDQPAIRELAGNSQAMMSGIETAYQAYAAAKAANPDKLPVFTLGKKSPVKSGGGGISSTNWHPTFNLVGWVSRGDLQYVPRTQGTATAATLPPVSYTNGSGRPATGGTVTPAPQAPAAVSADDFG